MKKFIKKIKNFCKEVVSRVKTAVNNFKTVCRYSKMILACKRGENFIDSGFKVLIIVVLAALLLTGLYILLGDVIMPTLTERVKELFNYKG